MELINSFYSIGVVNTDLSLTNIPNLIGRLSNILHILNYLNFVDLVINAISALVILPRLVDKAQNEADCVTLKVRQSYLSAKLTWLKNAGSSSAIGAITVVASPVPTVNEYKNTQQQLVQCEEEYQEKSSRNFDNLQLELAVRGGYQEGGETVKLATCLPLFILAAAHVVTVATCPPLFFALLGVTIACGLYRAHYRYQEAKKKIAEKNDPLPSSTPAAAPPAPVITQRLSEAFCGLFASEANLEYQATRLSLDYA
jgi:hypothetical protein